MRICRKLFLATALLWPVVVLSKSTLDEQVVGPANAGGWYVFSPNGGHVAYAGNRGTRVGVMVDGVAGPTFDELYNPFGQSFMSPANIAAITASPGGRTNQASQGAPVIMSADGQHYAYIGRQGEEYVVIHDGKEIARGPRNGLSLNYNPLTLSPAGKHVFWNETTGAGSARWLQRLVIDGKPGPWSGHQDILPVFNADETRYAYTYISSEDANKRELIVDGKPAAYQGRNPMFTADGKYLLTEGPDQYGRVAALLVDGKPQIKTSGLRKVLLAPVGSRYAAIAFREASGGGGVYVLYIDGREIPDTENVSEVWFSPDGKHYAAAIENKAARSMYMIVDGKKQREYQGVNTNIAPVWFDNNSRFIYLVTGGGRPFVVVDDQEYEIAYLGGNKIVTAGPHYAYHTYDGSNRKHSLIIDGQEKLLAGFYPRGFGLSPDGKRHAYQASQIGRSDVAGMVVDGSMIEGFFPHQFGNLAGGSNTDGLSGFRFSPDSQHLAMIGGYKDPSSVGLYVDNKLVFPSPRQMLNLTFTPDSNYLTWLTSKTFPDRPQPYNLVYLNGEQVLKLGSIDLLRVGGTWDMSKEGVLTVVSVDGDQVKRFRITPDPEMKLANWVSQAEESLAGLQAEKQQAEKQAAADAAAAKAKIEADQATVAAKAKEDAEALAAKRKADYEAAVAAKQKAYQEAVEAKRKARLLQLENAKRARQGLPPLQSLPE